MSFKVGRIFTNYSGDVSGRFLELAVLSSPPGRLSPPTLAPALAEVANYQRGDGHFGAEMDLETGQTGDSGRKTEFVKACSFMGIQRFLYIVPYILLPDLLRTAIRGMGRAALRPKA